MALMKLGDVFVLPLQQRRDEDADENEELDSDALRVAPPHRRTHCALH